jgi:electron transfer flavoprotein beta subunit
MNIVVLVKQVPDTYSERKLRDSDGVLDREATDAVLDEINERAVEAALQIKEAGDAEVTVLTMGPDRATDAIRKALSMGIGTVGDVDLVIAGNEASDGRGGAMAAMVAELLGFPALTHAREISVEGTAVTVKRETDDGVTHLSADLPAVVSVGEKINEPRYPSFKGIMAAKKKPVTTLSLADAGLDAGEVGLGNALTTVTSASPKPPKAAGEKIEDEGDGGSKIAAFLVGQKLI